MWSATGRLTCSRGAGAPAIAEFVLAAMLAFEKQLRSHGSPSRPTSGSNRHPWRPGRPTLGVVGLGSIGTQVATRALAFDMKVVALRRSQRPSPLAGVTLSPSLPAVLGGSDHVVVAAPATAETRRLIGESAFSGDQARRPLRPMCRGDPGRPRDALVRALDDGRIGTASPGCGGAPEAVAGRFNPLYRHPRVRLSPHISWSSPQTVARTFPAVRRQSRPVPLGTATARAGGRGGGLLMGRTTWC